MQIRKPENVARKRLHTITFKSQVDIVMQMKSKRQYINKRQGNIAQYINGRKRYNKKLLQSRGKGNHNSREKCNTRRLEKRSPLQKITKCAFIAQA